MVVVDPMKQVRIRPVLDATLTLATAAPTFALNVWVNRSLPPAIPTPGTTPEVARFDRLALGRFDPTADLASDITVGLSVGVPVIYHVIEASTRAVPRGERRRTFGIAFGTDLVILVEAMAINGLLTEVLKAAVRRPRPYTYLTCADVEPDLCDDLMVAQQEPDANWSFPSGHTSHAFTAATAGATLLTLELVDRANWAVVLAWIGGAGLAATTGAMRVLAGKHFGSDVFTSALLGAGVGAAVPMAHWRAPERVKMIRQRSVAGWTISPMRGPSLTGISVQGILR